MKFLSPVAFLLLPMPVTAPLAQTPQRTTATGEDGTVRCEVAERVKSGKMVQAIQIRGQAQPITQIAGHRALC